ncbi:MAG: VOC family protein [Armatimonadetes bacterium]|nr:VOC family protein [Armatimonadota bacterium]
MADCSIAKLILDVGNMPRSLAFYHGVLHLPLIEQQVVDGHRLARLSSGSIEIMLVEQPQEDQGDAQMRLGGMVVIFWVDDFEEMLKFVRTASTKILSLNREGNGGPRSMLVTDPDGYTLLLSERSETVH